MFPLFHVLHVNISSFDLILGVCPLTVLVTPNCPLQLLMCGTGDISVSDFKAHAVVVGGSWHFREKVSGPNFFSVDLCHFARKNFQKKIAKESDRQTHHLGRKWSTRKRQVVVQTEGSPGPQGLLQLPQERCIRKVKKQNQPVRGRPADGMTVYIPGAVDSPRGYPCPPLPALLLVPQSPVLGCTLSVTRPCALPARS